jgi:hypothetical protein
VPDTFVSYDGFHQKPDIEAGVFTPRKYGRRTEIALHPQSVREKEPAFVVSEKVDHDSSCRRCEKTAPPGRTGRDGFQKIQEEM